MPRQGALEGAGTAAEGVVLLGVGIVDRDADARDADLGHPARRLGRDERAVGRHDRPQPDVARVRGDLEDVGPHERLAAGEDEDRVAGLGDLVDEAEALLGGQLVGVRPVQRRGAAVGADAGCSCA